MIVLKVFYPHTEGARFDEAYYVNNHMPLAAKTWAPHATGWKAMRGVPAGADQPAKNVMIGEVYFDSMEAFGQAMAAPGGADVAADVPNYTDIVPTTEIFETV